MANILVIGGAGFIGSNLIKKLIDSHNIFLYDFPNVSISKLETYRNRINIFYGAINQYDNIIKIIHDNSISIVIHLASGLIPSSSIDEYLEEYNRVIIPTIRLLPYLSEQKVKFVFFSSGGTIYGSMHSDHASESERSYPICYYGLTKQILEDSIQYENRTSGLEFLIIRPSNPYGPGQSTCGKQGLIATSIGKILNHEKIVIWGDGSVVRDYIYIDDLSYAISELIRLDVKNEIFNIGSGIGYSVNEIIQELRLLVSTDFNVEYTSGRAVDVPSLILDNSKLKSKIFFSPTSLDEGISKFLNFQKNKK